MATLKLLFSFEFMTFLFWGDSHKHRESWQIKEQHFLVKYTEEHEIIKAVKVKVILNF